MLVASFMIVAVVSKKSLTLEFTLTSLVILVAVNTLVYFMGKFLNSRPNLTILVISILLGLTGMFYIKLLQPVLPTLPPIGRIAVPLGISYYTFKHVHYLIDRSRNNIEESDLLTFSNYVFFFPMFIAGPIERYQNFHSQAQNVKFDGRQISTGLERIVIGLSQKMIVSDLFLSAMMPPQSLVSDGLATLQFHQVLFASYIKFLKIYFDFAGYTSIAIGVGLLFGIKLMENFNFPLLRPTLAEFWRCWHISLSSWARDYVYFPVLMKNYFQTSSPTPATHAQVFQDIARSQECAD